MAPTLSLVSTIALRNGALMPRFGLGTWLSEKGGEAAKAVVTSLQNGYKMIDTAQMYNNEEDVGSGIKESGVSREEVFVVTKLGTDKHGNDACRQALKESLQKLQLNYVDLFLIHSPQGGKIVETWGTLLKLRDEGLTKSVGVSNFGVDQLKNLKETGLELPEINQVEMHMWNQQPELVQWCRQNGVTVMGYCPLARCKKFGEGISQSLSEKLSKSEAQIAIRWSLQNDIITIPKSSSAERIKQNADIFGFELSEEDMKIVAESNVQFKASNACNSQDIPWTEVA